MADYLADKYKAVRPDVVIALGDRIRRLRGGQPRQGGTRRAHRFRRRFRRGGGAAGTAGRVVGALTEFDVGRTLGLRDLQPDARNVVVMAGSTPFDKAWLKAARRDLALSDYRASYVTDLSLEGFRSTGHGATQEHHPHHPDHLEGFQPAGTER